VVYTRGEAEEEIETNQRRLTKLGYIGGIEIGKK